MVDSDGFGGFRRERELAPLRGRVLVMSAALLLVAAALFWQGSRPSVESDERLINVTGDVERPGWYSVVEGEVRIALEASGAETTGFPDELLSTHLDAGWGVSVGERGLSFNRPIEPLAFALPIDVNSASSEALQAIPGIGESLAQAIVSEREQVGLFNSVEELVRVHGIGPVTVEAIAPFIDVRVGLDETSRGDIGSQ